MNDDREVVLGGVPAKLIRKAANAGAQTLKVVRHGDHFHARAKVQTGRAAEIAQGPGAATPGLAVEAWIETYKADRRRGRRR